MEIWWDDEIPTDKYEGDDDKSADGAESSEHSMSEGGLWMIVF